MVPSSGCFRHWLCRSVPKLYCDVQDQSPSLGTFMDEALRPLKESLTKAWEDVRRLEGQQAKLKEGLAALRKDRLAREEQTRSIQQETCFIFAVVQESES